MLDRGRCRAEFAAGAGCARSCALARSSAATRRPRSGCANAAARLARRCATGCGTTSARCSPIACGTAASSARSRRPASIRCWPASRRRSRPQHLLHWLDDPRKFGGFWRLPSVTRDDPAYHDNVYWRGRIWPPLNLLTYLGLRRADQSAAAERLAADSHRLFEQAWAKGQCPENFNAESGARRRSAGHRPVLWLGRADAADRDPRHLAPDAVGRLGDRAASPAHGASGRCCVGGHDIRIAAADGWVSLHRDGVEIAATDMPGTLWRVAIADGCLVLPVHRRRRACAFRAPQSTG